MEGGHTGGAQTVDGHTEGDHMRGDHMGGDHTEGAHTVDGHADNDHGGGDPVGAFHAGNAHVGNAPARSGPRSWCPTCCCVLFHICTYHHAFALRFDRHKPPRFWFSLWRSFSWETCCDICLLGTYDDVGYGYVCDWGCVLLDWHHVRFLGGADDVHAGGNLSSPGNNFDPFLHWRFHFFCCNCQRKTSYNRHGYAHSCDGLSLLQSFFRDSWMRTSCLRPCSTPPCYLSYERLTRSGLLQLCAFPLCLSLCGNAPLGCSFRAFGFAATKGGQKKTLLLYMLSQLRAAAVMCLSTITQTVEGHCARGQTLFARPPAGTTQPKGLEKKKNPLLLSPSINCHI